MTLNERRLQPEDAVPHAGEHAVPACVSHASPRVIAPIHFHDQPHRRSDEVRSASRTCSRAPDNASRSRPPPRRAQAAARKLARRPLSTTSTSSVLPHPRPSTSEHGAEPDAWGRQAARSPSGEHGGWGQQESGRRCMIGIMCTGNRTEGSIPSTQRRTTPHHALRSRPDPPVGPRRRRRRGIPPSPQVPKTESLCESGLFSLRSGCEEICV